MRDFQCCWFYVYPTVVYIMLAAFNMEKMYNVGSNFLSWVFHLLQPLVRFDLNLVQLFPRSCNYIFRCYYLHVWNVTGLLGSKIICNLIVNTPFFRFLSSCGKKMHIWKGHHISRRNARFVLMLERTYRIITRSTGSERPTLNWKVRFW